MEICCFLIVVVVVVLVYLILMVVSCGYCFGGIDGSGGFIDVLG